jgi:hypothetical protein
MSERTNEPNLQVALAADAETASIEFKSSFDPSQPSAWPELIKDIVAMANSGGGALIIGLDDHGRPTGHDVSHLLQLDPADFTNKLHRYTGYQFSEFSLHSLNKAGSTLLGIAVSTTRTPLVFEKPGTYDIGDGNQKIAFREGSLYFRHGAKSEPANNDDIRTAFEKGLQSARQELLKNVRQVVEAPVGSTIVTVMPSEDEAALPVRLSEDPNAPLVGRMEPDVTHPYRLKALVQEVNRNLPPSAQINQYDIQAVRNVHNTDSNLALHYLSKYSGHQYSAAFAKWLADQFRNDPAFFKTARVRYHQKRRSR